jgi:hypothetical protein
VIISRSEKLRWLLKVQAQVGLEFRALCSPVVTREDGPVFYADVLSTRDLRLKYAQDPAVDVSEIVEVDYVTGNQKLSAVVEPGREFDYVILNHVFEHLPSPLSYLADLRSILSPRGLVCCAIPDMRRTFDACRRETTLGDLAEAFFLDHRSPSFGAIFDHFSEYVPASAEGPMERANLRHQRLRDALGWAQVGMRGERYVDVHAHTFTPSSLLRLLRDAAALGLLGFELARFWPTATGESEFHVILRRTEQEGGGEPAEATFERFLIPGNRLRGESDCALEEARLIAAQGNLFGGRVFFVCGSRRFWVPSVDWALAAGYRWPDDIAWLTEEEVASQPESAGDPPPPEKVLAARNLLGLL